MKKEFGQFYTTNYEYILENIKIPETVFNIIEPFVGKGDLLKFIQDKQKYFIETYDIEPKYNEAVKRASPVL